MILAHNLAAMNTQRQFNIVGDQKKKSTEKLSSGYKINRAADDAAGLTISETVRSKIRALNQGSDNTQDGISWIQVADGAMAEAHDMVHRLKELSVYASNGTLTDEDRNAIDREVQGILDEIHRIDMSTQFNTKDVFLHGDVMFDVHGEPGDLEVYDAISDGNGVTYGGFIFHGARVRFDEVNALDGAKSPSLVRMENGKQVFNGGTYRYSNGTEFFTIEVEDGAEVPEAKRRITVDATDDGIKIDGHLVEWSKMRDEDGYPVDPSNPKRGTFSVPYGDSVLDITIGAGCSLRSKQEFIDAIKKHESVQDNGGVSYNWITEVQGIYSRNAMSSTPAQFAGDAVSAGSAFKRNIDNIMAYDSNTDLYDSDFSNGLMEYKLVAELVEKSENIKVHNDLASGTATATKRGMDVDNQDIRLYLVGTDGKEIAGSSVLMSALQPNKITTNDWVKGMGLSDGDSCGDHAGWTYDSRDNFVDKTFTYTDPSKKTDISMDFKLSEVVSPDSIAFNVELVDAGKKIQDYNKGLNGTTYFQKFDSEFTDQMTVSDSDNKVSVRSNSTTYKASYDLNIALGRNFDDATDTLAKINGDTSKPGNEGNIVYNKAKQNIVFSIKVDAPTDKTSSNYATTRDKNDVAFFEFDASTVQAEGDFNRNIVAKARKITNDKIDVILSGAANDKLTILPPANETIILRDENVMVGKGLDDAERRYVYDYDYSDLMTTFNDGTDNTNGAGKQITIKMSDKAESYTGALLAKDIKDKYLQLKTDYKFTYEKTAHATGSYINATDLTNDIGNAINKANDILAGKGGTYVLNKLSATNEYITDSAYKAIISGAINDAKTGIDYSKYTDKVFVITKSGIREKQDLIDNVYTTPNVETIKKAEQDAIGLLQGDTNAYYELDEFGNRKKDAEGNDIMLSGDALVSEVVKRLSDPVKNVDSFVIKEFEKFSPDKFTLKEDGTFAGITGGISDIAIKAEALVRAKKDVDKIIADDNTPNSKEVLEKFIDVLNCSDAEKSIFKDNINNILVGGISGSFSIDAPTLNSVLNAAVVDKIANNTTKTATKLGDAGAPAASESNIKNILLTNYKNVISDTSGNDKITADYIGKYIESEAGWNKIKGNLVAEDGKVLFYSRKGALGSENQIKKNQIIGDLRTHVVDNLTDGKLRTIEGYYDDKRVIDQIVRTGSDKDNDGYREYEFNIDDIIGDKGATPTKVAFDANEYTIDAMNDIAKTSTFTLEAAGFATTEMNTKSDPGKVSYARYASDIEVEFLGGLDIQHSNKEDDFTTIQQFCFNTAVMKITSVNLSTQESAKRAMGKIDYALDYISEKRSLLGATQNRLEHTYNNNRNKEENLTAAESRIRDTDMAKEVMNNTKLNILEQVMTSVMAQANQSRQGVLALLQ